MRPWAVLVLAGCNLGPFGADRVELEPGRLEGYYLETEKRANLWFCGERVPGRACAAMPALPELEDLRGAFYFVEASSGPTCYFNPRTGRIDVPADKWESGCVPHELGHAALHELGHRCASIFEHPPNRDRAPEECR